MGLFDFLKPRQTPYERHKNNPILMWMKLEFLQKQISSLRAVNRDADADRAISEFLEEVFQKWKTDPQNPDHLPLLAHAAMELGKLEYGKDALERVIEANKKTPSLDLTLVYTDLGRIYHFLGNNPEKELLCYDMATKAVAPINCKAAATKKDKAKAHHFAGMCAYRIGKEEHSRFHEQKWHELVPEIDFDDTSKILEWMRGK